MKRVLSILVLCIFMAHFAGFYIYFFVQLKQVRKEMRAQLQTLPEHQLDLISFSSRDFKKARVEEHEIKVNGKMYDIARVEKRGDVYFVYCLHDKAEENLLAFLDKILSLPLKDKSVPSGVLQFMSLNFLPVNWNFPFPEFQREQSFTPYTEMLSLFNTTIAGPPPKI